MIDMNTLREIARHLDARAEEREDDFHAEFFRQHGVKPEGVAYVAQQRVLRAKMLYVDPEALWLDAFAHGLEAARAVAEDRPPAEPSYPACPDCSSNDVYPTSRDLVYLACIDCGNRWRRT